MKGLSRKIHQERHRSINLRDFFDENFLREFRQRTEKQLIGLGNQYGHPSPPNFHPTPLVITSLSIFEHEFYFCFFDFLFVLDSHISEIILYLFFSA